MTDKIAVIGSGAIGGFVAGELRDAGRDVTLCVRTAFDRLTIVEGERVREIAVPVATSPEQVAPASCVFITTKSQDTRSTQPWLDRLVGPDTVVVVIQNGVGHVERVRPLAPSARAVLPAIIYCAAERVAPGRILHHAYAALSIPEGPGSAEVATAFEGTAFKVAQEKDFATIAWRKLLGNAVANPITALTLRRLRAFGEPGLQDLARGILREAVTVAAAEGARLTEADAEEVLAAFGRNNSDGGSSMLYDRLAQRPLEHDYITGAVVAAAEKHGIAVPLNRAILALCQVASGHPLDGSE